MQVGNDTPTVDRLKISPQGVLIIAGFSAGLFMQGNQLRARSGTGRTGRFERAGRPPLRHVVVIGRHGGSVTLPALAFVLDQGASLTWISQAGELLMTSVRRPAGDVRLRRAQMTALGTDCAMGIIRYLVATKVHRQADLVARRFHDPVQAQLIREHADATESAKTPQEVMLFESQAANLYWRAWTDHIAPNFVRRDADRIPPRWRAFAGRSSPIGNGPRRSCDPVNSALNVGYGFLEGQTRIGMCAAGLDPDGAFGLHADLPHRSGAVLDVMEPCRVVADDLVVRLFDDHAFARNELVELPNGVVRIGSALSAALASAWVPVLANAVGPIVERVAAILAEDSGLGRRATHLTGSNRSAGRDGIRKGPRRERTAARVRAHSLPSACRRCGQVLASKGAVCSDCLLEHRQEALATASARAREQLLTLRVAGADPAHGGEARRKRAEALRRRQAEAQAWSGDRPDPSEFEPIRAALRAVPVRQIAATTGLTRAYCGGIRSGRYTPHVRWWAALRELGTVVHERK